MYSTVRVITPPAVEPVSVDLARSHIRVDFLDDNDLIALYATTARTAVENYLNRSLITQTLRWTMSQTRNDGIVDRNTFLWSGYYNGLWNNLSSRKLEIPRAPVQAVSSVSLMDYLGNITTVDPSLYVLDTMLDPARISIHATTTQTEPEHISITYTAGYGAAMASIPMPIIQAILLLTAHFYERRGDDGGEWPAGVAALLGPYRLVTFGG